MLTESSVNLCCAFRGFLLSLTSTVLSWCLVVITACKEQKYCSSGRCFFSNVFNSTGIDYIFSSSFQKVLFTAPGDEWSQLTYWDKSFHEVDRIHLMSLVWILCQFCNCLSAERFNPILLNSVCFHFEGRYSSFLPKNFFSCAYSQYVQPQYTQMRLVSPWTITMNDKFKCLRHHSCLKDSKISFSLCLSNIGSEITWLQTVSNLSGIRI